jgi:hypothetical protein
MDFLEILPWTMNPLNISETTEISMVISTHCWLNPHCCWLTSYFPKPLQIFGPSIRLAEKKAPEAPMKSAAHVPICPSHGPCGKGWELLWCGTMGSSMGYMGLVAEHVGKKVNITFKGFFKGGSIPNFWTRPYMTRNPNACFNDESIVLSHGLLFLLPPDLCSSYFISSQQTRDAQEKWRYTGNI